MARSARFANQRILVTGASQGIGAATVRRLTQEGAQVVALARSRERLAALQAELGCIPLVADLGDIHAVCERLDEFPDLDALVNCAGVVHVERVLDTEPAHVAETFAVNLFAPLFLARRLASAWVRRGRAGAIVNVSSIASHVGTPGHAAYCASKAGLDALTRVLAVELGAAGIRTNSVNPVVTRTPMAERAWADPAKAAAMRARIPLARFAAASEVAAAIAFLLSRDAAMINGTCLDVDGGFSAG